MMDLQLFVGNAPDQFLKAVRSLEGASAEQLETEKDNRLRPLLDSILTVGLESGLFDESLITHIRDAYYRIYDRVRNLRFPHITSVDLDESWIWGEVVKRVYILGAALIDRRQFQSSAQLINQPVTWDDYWSDFLWCRHALTMLARAGKLERKGLVTITLQEFEREPWFLTPFSDDREVATSMLCQFDFLQCIHVVHKTNRREAAYPSFGLYYKTRTEPLIVSLITDRKIRSEAIPEMSDDRLAEIILVLEDVAIKEAFMVAGWDPGWSDMRIRSFLQASKTEGE